MAKVFIDGAAGTTGLAIRERLAGRRDLDLITLPEEVRKDPAARAEALNRADAAILCLPDAAAVEAVGLIDPANTHTAVIDTSTAHRTAEGWTYGFPELAGQREKIRASKRIANPGCHASGFIALAAPLRDAGILPADARLTVTSLTGYSGGGKKMIAEYEAAGRDPLLGAPRMYGLSQTHKHLPEMKAVCRLDREPIFCPIVAPFYAGMEVVLPLFAEEIGTDAEGIAEIYRSYYGEGGAVRFSGSAGEKEGGFLSAGAFAGRDSMEITVAGNGERILLTARFDNLGKGASGAAVQNMNLLLGFEEYAGLNL